MQRDLGFQFYLSDKDNKFLLPIIKDLQNKYERKPSFSPHISIHTAIKTTLEQAIKAVENATCDMSQFKVFPDGFGFQNRWSKILYIKIEPYKGLVGTHNIIGTYFNALDPRPYIPHISLMYKDDLEDKVRQEITEKITLPQSFTVKGIEVVDPGDNNEDWRDYTKWKIIYRKEFH